MSLDILIKLRANVLNYKDKILSQYKKVRCLLTVFLISGTLVSNAQIVADTFYIPHYPVPEIYFTDNAPELPPTVNNRLLPFFPPIFYNQKTLPNCGQVSGHFYCLTYQFNRLLNRTADSLGSFSPTYTYNFLNGGNGWYGASTFDSWNIVKSQGNPTEAIFDGPPNATETQDRLYEGKYWMNGYDKYYQSMKYRIKDYYAIDVSSDEGLRLLKHFLNNHFKAADNGGVAIFYSGTDFLYHPPYGYIYDSIVSYPFEKMYFYNYLSPGTGHSMTIAGYYKNTQIDFNGDGLITDSIDINGDEIINYLDNETTFWIIVNSYGEHDGKGAFLIRYRELTRVWNKEVYVPIPDTAYKPELTFKIRMKHNQRNSIKISAGISSDINSTIPEKTIDFPIFNYQGGNRGLSGIDSLSNADELEFGIDITDLLDYIDADGMARVFLRIENAGHQTGELDFFSVRKYSEDQVQEYIYTDKSMVIPAAELSEFYINIPLSSTASPDYVNIIGDTKFIVYKDQELSQQISVKGGSPPYQFKLFNNNEYNIELTNRNYNMPTGFDIYNNHYINPEWKIPFAGEYFDSVAISSMGTISFSGKHQIHEKIYPYRFDKEAVYEDLTISIFNGNFFNTNYISKYNISDSSIIVWNRSTSPFFFTRSEIFKDGRIEIFISDSIWNSQTNDLARHFGITTYMSTYFSPQIPLRRGGNYNTTVFHPQNQHSQFSICKDGLLIMDNTAIPGIYQTHIMVRDEKGEKAIKRIEVEILDKKFDLALYPNPAKNTLTISVNSYEYSNLKISIYDIRGAFILSESVKLSPGKNENQINISELPAGLYLSKIEGKNINRTLRFVILP